MDQNEFDAMMAKINAVTADAPAAAPKASSARPAPADGGGGGGGGLAEPTRYFWLAVVTLAAVCGLFAIRVAARYRRAGQFVPRAWGY